MCMEKEKSVSTVMGDFDYKRLAALKAAYTVADDSDLSSFMFEGQKWETSFAFYLIQYLNDKF